MLHRASRLKGSPVSASDGPIGTVHDLYFDDERWTVRYVVVDTGSWLDGRRVLISPMSVAGGWDTVALEVRLTRDQVRRSPGAHTAQPLSRQYETELLQHYGYPMYWGGPGIWGAYGIPAALLSAPQPAAPVVAPPKSPPGDRHLRSVAEVTGYHILARDGEIGHVDDFLIGEEDWRIRYLQLDTSNWIGGRAVVIAPGVIEGIDWVGRQVRVAVEREAVQNSPRVDSVDLPSGEQGPPFAVI